MTTKIKNPVGRPSVYSEELADRICERLVEGESLRKICADEEMPNKATVSRWIASNDNFATRCARARETGADVLLDEMEDIEDRTLGGELDHRAANVVLSSKQWRASKLAPKKYGARIDHTSSDKSMSPSSGMSELANMTDEELELYEKLATLRSKRDQAGEE